MVTTRKNVMISSTARDLPVHREQVRLACERAGFAPHEMMEHGTAEGASPAEVSLRMVGEADVYVLILAFRYGTVPPGQDLSLTEMEYNRAVALKKPMLVFVADKRHPITIGDVDTGPGAAKLQALKERIGEAHVTAFFKSPEDLRACAFEALNKLGKTLAEDAPDEMAAAKMHRRSAIPTTPEPYIAHPYTLLQTRDLVGRQTELSALTDWVAKPGSPAFEARILALVAIGGMGKSALTWKWFQDIAPNEMKPLAGRMWWSFYESDATFENFVLRALCYVSGENEEDAKRRPWHECETLLLQHLNESPYLIVLDGLERALLAYHRIDASSLADDAYDQRTANYVANAYGLPASAAQSFTGEHRLRNTIDPRAGVFLRKLSRIKHSRVLISTRLYPYALQLPTGDTAPGSVAYFLGGLTDDGAVELWRTLKVTGSRAELAPIFHSVRGHPLLVQVFAGLIAHYRKAPGDFARWKADHPEFGAGDMLDGQARSRIIAVALDGLSPKLLDALQTMVAFRIPATYAMLEALLVGSGKAFRTAQAFDRALNELEDRGLIGWDREANRYDAHPIVRDIVWKLASTRDQRAVLTALDAYFEPMSMPDDDDVESVSDLTPAIERFHSLTGLARYDDAFGLFRHRLDQPTLLRLALHRDRIAWLERLIGDSDRPRLSSPLDQASFLNSLAHSYSLTGRPQRAIELYRRSLEIDREGENFRAQRGLLANLAEEEIDTGDLYQSFTDSNEALALARRLNDRHGEADVLARRGRLLCTTGDVVHGNIALFRACKLLREQGRFALLSIAYGWLAERACWLGQFAAAALLADQAWVIAENLNYQHHLGLAELVQGRSALGKGELNVAEERLNQVVNRARLTNLADMEFGASISLAQLELARGQSDKARRHINEIWEAVDLGPYRIFQADACNVLFQVEISVGDKLAAAAAATNAYKWSWCDGPPYAYHWGLRAAKANLDSIGGSDPDMPAFDAAAHKEPSSIDINPKDEHWIDPDKLEKI